MTGEYQGRLSVEMAGDDVKRKQRKSGVVETVGTGTGAQLGAVGDFHPM